MSAHIYLTKLPTKVCKLGKGSGPASYAFKPGSRAKAAQTYFTEEVSVVDAWDVPIDADAREYERVALAACAEYKNNNTSAKELFDASASVLSARVSQAFRFLEKRSKCFPALDNISASYFETEVELIARQASLATWSERCSSRGYCERSTFLFRMHYAIGRIQKEKPLYPTRTFTNDVSAVRRSLQEKYEYKCVGFFGPDGTGGWSAEQRLFHSAVAVSRNNINNRLHYFDLDARLDWYKKVKQQFSERYVSRRVKGVSLEHEWLYADTSFEQAGHWF